MAMKLCELIYAINKAHPRSDRHGARELSMWVLGHRYCSWSRFKKHFGLEG